MAISILFIAKEPLRRRNWTGDPAEARRCRREDGLLDHAHRKFAIVLDAGSTGSRIHVYRFRLCGDHVSSVEREIFSEVKPGLSSFSGRPEDASRSLIPLLKEAKKMIPRDLYKCTPLVLRATAGLRLLPDAESGAILKAVRSRIEKLPFHLGPIDGRWFGKRNERALRAVSIMDGREEGLLAWLTIRFLQTHTNDSVPVVLELGGGSAQIVFEVDSVPSSSDREVLANHYSKEHFAGQQHTMYQHSFLGYGLIEARRAVVHGFAKLGRQSSFPCIPKGYRADVGSNHPAEGHFVDWATCQDAIKEILFVQRPCGGSSSNPANISSCSINGVHQPTIPPSKPIAVLSFFSDRLGKLNLLNDFTINDIKDVGVQVCRADDGYRHLLSANPLYCFDLVYIHTLLAYGYKLGPSNLVSCVKKINGFEAGWALGSAVQILAGSEFGACPRY